MKKLLIIALAMVCAFTLTECATRGQVSTQTAQPKETTETSSRTVGSLAFNNKAFGTWNNHTEIKSYTALSQNIHNDTMLFLGSSEFNHGEDSEYHVRNLFKKQNVSIMLIGHVYNQCLNQAVTAGALGPKLKKRKIVLVISPTWFFPGGVPASGYSKVFSLSNYMAFMENKKIPRTQKRYVARRTESLLAGNRSMLSKVQLVDNIYVRGKNTRRNKSRYALVKRKTALQDYNAVKKALSGSGIKKRKTYNGYIKSPAPLNWDQMRADAQAYEDRNMSTRMFMSNDRWDNNFAYKYNTYKDRYAGSSFNISPEYADLQCFMKVCQAQKIQTMLLVLPVNGQWYDYCGLHQNDRKYVGQRVRALGSKYNAKVVDFTDYDYKPYFLEDNVHPWRLGWIDMNKAVYDFYQDNIKDTVNTTSY